MRFFALSLLLIGLSSAVASAQATMSPPGSDAASKEVRITYVGNSGFLIQAGGKKILIDALFFGFRGDYELPQAIRDQAMRAQAPFDNIDLILVTHSHADHFDAALVRRHLENSPKTILASTAQVADSMSGFPGRVISFDAKKEKPDIKDIGGISVEALYLPHGPVQAGQTEVVNYGYVVRVGDFSFFHSGDMDSSQFTYDAFRAYGLPEKKIDIAFVQHFYLTDDAAERRLVREGIGARYILPIHYHFTLPAFDRAALLSAYPDAIVFEREMQSWVMPQPRMSWSPLREIPSPHMSGEAVICEGKIHLVGGRAKAGINRSFHFSYDPTKDSWETKAALKESVANLALASVAGKIYAIGGDSFKRSVEIYDPSKDEWTYGAPMPTGRQHLDCAVVDGKIYVIGGLENWSKFSNKNEVYDPVSDTWETRAPMPTPRHNAAVQELGGKIYVIGGAGDKTSIWTSLATVEVYDPSTDTWEIKRDLPVPRAKPMSAAIGGTILLLGGADTEVVVSRVDLYDPASDSWRRIGDFPRPVVFGSLVSIGSRIFVMGGCGDDFAAYSSNLASDLDSLLVSCTIQDTYYGSFHYGEFMFHMTH